MTLLNSGIYPSYGGYKYMWFHLLAREDNPTDGDTQYVVYGVHGHEGLPPKLVKLCVHLVQGLTEPLLDDWGTEPGALMDPSHDLLLVPPLL